MVPRKKQGCCLKADVICFRQRYVLSGLHLVPPSHPIAFPSAQRARTFPRLRSLKESIEQSAAESKCAKANFFQIRRQEPHAHQSSSKPSVPCFFLSFSRLFRVLLLRPQRPAVQRGSPGSRDHHSRAVRRPSAVGAAGSEEHPRHRTRGAATDSTLDRVLLCSLFS